MFWISTPVEFKMWTSGNCVVCPEKLVAECFGNGKFVYFGQKYISFQIFIGKTKQCGHCRCIVIRYCMGKVQWIKHISLYKESLTEILSYCLIQNYVYSADFGRLCYIEMVLSFHNIQDGTKLHGNISWAKSN